MSMFSGKCDFADHVAIFGLEDTLKSNIYVGDNIVPLKIETEKDLIPYYPRIISVSTGDHIWLSNESYADEEERSVLESMLKDAIRQYKRCKRKNKVFDPVKSNWWRDEASDEIYRRVAEYGEKATIEGVKTRIGEIYRKELYDAMVNAGWSVFKSYLWVYKDIVGAFKASEELSKE